MITKSKYNKLQISKKMKIQFALIALVLASMSTFVFGCTEINAATSDLRAVDQNFYGIILNGNANVYLMQSESNSIRLEGSQGNVDEVETSVENGALIINSGSLRNVNVYITMNDINLLQVNGSGVIHAMSTINSDMLLMKITGSGIIKADVRALSIGMIINGGGKIYTSGMTGDSFVKVKGTGEVVAMNLDSLKQTASVDYVRADYSTTRKPKMRRALTLHQ
jgi:hypothetical protein